VPHHARGIGAEQVVAQIRLVRPDHDEGRAISLGHAQDLVIGVAGHHHMAHAFIGLLAENVGHQIVQPLPAFLDGLVVMAGVEKLPTTLSP